MAKLKLTDLKGYLKNKSRDDLVNEIAELMISYAEIGVRFTNEFGDIDERFYGTIEKAYINALEYIFKNNLQEMFRDRVDRIRINTNGIGWGFSDNMNDIFYNYYSGVEGD